MTKITVTQLLPMVYQDALQPGVKQLGVALESVLSLVPTLMLPFKYVSEAAKLRLSAHLNELRQKLESRNPDDTKPIAPEIGVPVIEKLLHTQDKQLASLYLQLLAQASDAKGQQFAHPSFPALIANLSPDEAALLQLFAGDDVRLTRPTLHFFLQHKEESSVLLRGPLTGWEQLIKIHFANNMPAYVMNLVRCGIFELSAHLPSGHIYSLRHHQDVEVLTKLYSPEFGQPMQIDTRLIVNEGHIHLTEYGQMFIRACVVPQPELLTGVTL